MNNQLTYGEIFFKKYYPIIEKIGILLFVLGIIFSLLLWPGGSFFSIIGGGILGQLTSISVFSPFSKIKIYSIPLGLFGSMGILGILFKWMFWPADSLLLKFSLVGLSVFLCLFYFKLKNLTDAAWDKRTFIGALVIYFSVGIIYGIPNLTLYKIKHRNDPKIVELYQRTLENPTDSLAQKEWQEYRKNKSVRKR